MLDWSAMKIPMVGVSLTVMLFFAGSIPAAANYTIVLKNGRQLTVESYREEGSAIKVFGLGGEFGIPKDQIQTISKFGQSDRPGLNIIDLETSTRRQQPQVPQKPAVPAVGDIKDDMSPGAPEITIDPEEEKEYRKRLAEVTQKLQAAREKYFSVTQGSGTAANVSQEGIRAWVMDFASRIHDSQKVPRGGGPRSTPPTPPYAPTYTAKEKELSELRTQIDSLQKERDALIQEMKSKNILIPF
jgi:hypothetical protein